MDWIQGEKFQTIADYTYTPQDMAPCDYIGYRNTLDLNLLKDGDIIYAQGFTHYKRQLLDVIRDKQKVILITHNCDNHVDDSFDLPDNVIRWYAENLNVINHRIDSIPLGIENDHWQAESHKKDKMIAKMGKPRNYRNLMYMNHNVINCPSERLKPYELFEGKSWVTSVRGKNGMDFDWYLENIYNHRFVISPRGTGLDTVRTWECLYMGTIPIEKRNINNQFYTDLPICFVDDWEEITEEYLERWLAGSSWQTWNMEKLTFEYWKNKIKNT